MPRSMSSGRGFHWLSSIPESSLTRTLKISLTRSAMKERLYFEPTQNVRTLLGQGRRGNLPTIAAMGPLGKPTRRERAS